MSYSFNKVYFDENTGNLFFVTDRSSCGNIIKTLNMLKGKNKKFSFVRNINEISFVLSYNSNAFEINEAVKNYIYCGINFSFTENGFVFCGEEELALKLYNALKKEEIFPKIFSSDDKTFVYIPA